MPHKKISVQEWGPYAWYYFHIMSYSFPDMNMNINMNKVHVSVHVSVQSIENKLNNITNKKKSIIDFYKIISNVLPCETCQNHYKKIMKVYPLEYSNNLTKNNLIHWVLNIHNSVNILTGKRKYSIERLNKLYILPGGKININHGFMIKIIYFIVVSNPSIKWIQLLFQNMLITFPCMKCRGVLKSLYSKKKYRIDLLTLIKKWLLMTKHKTIIQLK